MRVGGDGGREGGREVGMPLARLLYRSITGFLHHSSKLCGMQTAARGEV